MTARAIDMTELAIGGAAGALLLASLFVLQGTGIDRWLQSRLVPGNHRMGQVSRATRGVRRRKAGEVRWLPIASVEPVFEEDRVFTGPDATARIELDSRASIELAPDSLVVLRDDASGMLLEIQAGAVTGTLVPGGRLRVSAKGGGVHQVIAQSSEAEFELRAGIDAEVVIKPLRGQPAVESPPSAPESLVVPRFLAPVAAPSPVPSVVAAPPKSPEPVRAAAPPPAPPLLVSPTGGEVIAFATNPTRLNLAWRAGARAKSYLIEVASRENFAAASIIARERSARPALGISLTRAGRYFWRVRAVLGSGRLSEFSPPRAFELRVPRPNISKPNQDFEARLRQPSPPVARGWLDRMLTAFIPVAEAGEPSDTREGVAPLLKWEIIRSAARYRLEIAANPQFTPILEERFVIGNVFKWTRFRPGIFYWRVTAVDAAGKAGLPSATATLTVRVAPPVPQASRLSGPADFALEWSPTAFHEGYEIEVSDRADFKGAERLFASDPKVGYHAPHAGTFHWRVRALGTERKPLSRFSPARDLVVVAPVKPAVRVPASIAVAEAGNSWSFSGGIGPTLLSYSDTRGFDGSQGWLGARAALVRAWPAGGWELSGELSGQVVPLSSASDGSRRLVGGAVRGARYFALGGSDWSLGIAGGVYYVTLMSGDETSAFRNMAGPELFPVLRVPLRNGGLFSGSFRFSPVMRGLGSLSLAENQMVAAAVYRLAPGSGGSRLSFNLDATWLKLNIDNVAVRAQAVSFAIGYEL